MKFSTTAFLFVVGSGWISAFVPIHQKKVVTPSTFTRKRINKCNLNAAVSSNSDSDRLQELRDATRSIEAKRLSFEKELREFKEELDLLNESTRTLQQEVNVNRNSNDDNTSTGVTLTSSTDTARGFDGTKSKETDRFSLKDSYERASHPNVFRTVIPKRQDGQNNSVRFGMDYEAKEEEVMEADMSNKKEGHNARFITIAATAACLSFFSPSSNNNKNHNTKQDSSSVVSTSVATKATTPTSPITPFSFLSQKTSSNKEITKEFKPFDSSTNDGLMKMLFPNPPSTSTSEVREAEAHQEAAATSEDEKVLLSSETSPPSATSEFEEMQDKIRELKMQKEEILKALNTLRQEDEVNLVSPTSANDVSPSLSEIIVRTEKKEVKPSTERNSVMKVLFPNPPERSTVPAVSTATEVIDDSSNPTFQPSLSDDQTTLDSVSLTADTDEVKEKFMGPVENVLAQTTGETASPAQELQDTASFESIVTEAIDDSSNVIPSVIPTSSSLFDDQTTLDSMTADTHEMEEKFMGPVENVQAQTTGETASPTQELQDTASFESIVTEAIDDSSIVIPSVIPTSPSSFDDQTTLDSVSLTADTDEVKEKVMGPLDNVLAQSTEETASPAQELQDTTPVESIVTEAIDDSSTVIPPVIPTERNSVMKVLFPNPPERSTVTAVSTATEVIDDSSNPTFQSSLSDDQTTLDLLTADTNEMGEKIVEPLDNVLAQSTEEIASPAQETQDTTPVESKVAEAIDDSSTVIPPVIPTSSSLFDDQTTLDSMTADTNEMEEKVMEPLDNVLAQSTEEIASPAQELQDTASVALSQEMKVTDTDPSLELDTVKEVTPFAYEEEGETTQLLVRKSTTTDVEALLQKETDETKVPYEELSPTIVTETFMEEGNEQETSPTSTKSAVSSSSSFESFVNKVKSKSDDNDESIKVKQQEGGKVSIVFPATSKFDTVPMKMNKHMSNLHRPLVGVTAAAIGVSVGVTGAKNRNLFSRGRGDGNSSFSSSNDFETTSKKSGEDEGEENVVSKSFSLLQELDDTSTQQTTPVVIDGNDKKEMIIQGDYYKTKGPTETYADSLSSKSFATSTSSMSSKSFPKVGISGYADSLSSSKYHQVQDEIMAAIQADEKISSLEEKIKSLASLSGTYESKGENLVP